MARQITYINDADVTALDRLTGIDSLDNSTKNFTIEAIAQLFASTGIADPTKLSFFYDYNTSSVIPSTGNIRYAFVEGLEDTFGGISQVFISKIDKTGTDSEIGQNITPVTRFITGNDIKITDVDNASGKNYGIYNVTRVDNESDHVVLYVNHIASTGVFANGEVALSVIAGAAIEGGQRGNAVFDGDFIPTIENTPAVAGDIFIREYVDGEDIIQVDIYIFGTDWGEPTALRGARGPQGIQGIQGERGQTGDQGEQGERGTQGIQGNPGQTGARGETGPRGDSGATGESVTQVDSETVDTRDTTTVPGQIAEVNDTIVTFGTPSDDDIGSVVVHQGPAGSEGSPGAIGNRGPAGEQGVQGRYEIEVHVGIGATDIIPAAPTATFDGTTITLDQASIDAGWVVTIAEASADAGLTGLGGRVFTSKTFFDPANPLATLTWSSPFLAGAEGPAGPSGPPGPAGADGARGLQGDPGVGVTSITDDDGDGTATVLLSDGNTSSLPLPHGPIGPAGQTGARGATGDTGATGERGLQGIQGNPGETGPKGDPGDQGFQGIFDVAIFRRSEDDLTAEAAPADTSYNIDSHEVTVPTDWSLEVPVGTDTLYQSFGFVNPALAVNDLVTIDWSSAVEVTGDVGPAGPRGPKGDDGDAGAAGVDGRGITSITDDDADGTATVLFTDGATSDLPLPQGLQGERGETGPQGDPGTPGSTGPRGPQGQAGARGADGAQGDTGDQGERGVQGFTGDSISVGTVTPGANLGDDTVVVLEERNHLGQLVDTEDVTIRAGVPGEQGDQGDTGPSPVFNTDVIESTIPVDADGNSQDATSSIDNTNPLIPQLSIGVPVGSTGAQGDQGDTGASPVFNTDVIESTVPVNNDGSSGTATASIDNTNPLIPQLSVGIPVGATGEQGDPGNTILTGGLAPVDTQGVDGNFYIQAPGGDDLRFFGPKASGAWPTEFIQLVGDDGVNGETGPGYTNLNVDAAGNISADTVGDATDFVTTNIRGPQGEGGADAPNSGTDGVELVTAVDAFSFAPAAETEVRIDVEDSTLDIPVNRTMRISLQISGVTQEDVWFDANVSSYSGTQLVVEAIGVNGTNPDGLVGNFISDDTHKLQVVPSGAAGGAGSNGTDGDDGDSAYQIAVNNGFTGSQTQWLASLIGAMGADGRDGEIFGVPVNTDFQVNAYNPASINTAFTNGERWTAVLPLGTGWSPGQTARIAYSATEYFDGTVDEREDITAFTRLNVIIDSVTFPNIASTTPLVNDADNQWRIGILAGDDIIQDATEITVQQTAGTYTLRSSTGITPAVVTPANTNITGPLSSTDWDTFNEKLAATKSAVGTALELDGNADNVLTGANTLVAGTSFRPADYGLGLELSPADVLNSPNARVVDVDNVANGAVNVIDRSADPIGSTEGRWEFDIDLVDLGVTTALAPATYAPSSITIDTYGRVTAISGAHTREFGGRLIATPSTEQSDTTNGNVFDISFTDVTSGFTYNITSATVDDSTNFGTPSIISNGQTVRVTNANGVVASTLVHVVYSTTDSTTTTTVNNQTAFVGISVTAVPSTPIQRDYLYIGQNLGAVTTNPTDQEITPTGSLDNVDLALGSEDAIDAQAHLIPGSATDYQITYVRSSAEIQANVIVVPVSNVPVFQEVVGGVAQPPTTLDEYDYDGSDTSVLINSVAYRTYIWAADVTSHIRLTF